MNKNDKSYGIGIVGCGTISGTHAEAVIRTSHGTLVAAHSRNKSRLDTFCEKFGIEGSGYTDFSQFLSHPGLDMVVICTPTGTHLDYGKKAAQARKHIIIEKPIEINLKRGRELIESCRKNQVKLAVIYQNRFIDEVMELKTAVDEGKTGKPFMIDVSVKWFRNQEYYDTGGWRGTLALDGGGAVINQAIHTIDLMLWIAGDVDSLYACKGTFTHERMEGEDNAVAVLQFKSRAIGVFRASTSIVPPEPRKIKVHGPKGTAVLEGDVYRFLTPGDEPDRNDEPVHAAGASDPLAGMETNYHKEQYDQILQAIRKGRDPDVSGEESLKSLAVVEAIYASSDRRERVVLEEFLRDYSITD